MSITITKMLSYCHVCTYITPYTNTHTLANAYTCSPSNYPVVGCSYLAHSHTVQRCFCCRYEDSESDVCEFFTLRCCCCDCCQNEIQRLRIQNQKSELTWVEWSRQRRTKPRRLFSSHQNKIKYFKTRAKPTPHPPLHPLLTATGASAKSRHQNSPSHPSIGANPVMFDWHLVYSSSSIFGFQRYVISIINWFIRI